MRHFWYTDKDANNIMPDHRGNIRGAVKKAEDYQKKHPGVGTIYINEGEEIIECVFEDEEV